MFIMGIVPGMPHLAFLTFAFVDCQRGAYFSGRYNVRLKAAEQEAVKQQEQAQVETAQKQAAEVKDLRLG